MVKTAEIVKATQELLAMVEGALWGQRRSVELAACAFLAGGHLLIEDVPGVGKTTLARALARSSGGEFRRIQFTSDLLPADITGVSIWDAKIGEFHHKEGPIFGNVVLADEINRATPKTQSALLEAMSEGRVSVDGHQRQLPHPFMVIATQNAEEHHGAYPLPESQLDRFFMRISLGYPSREAERKIVTRPTTADPVDDLRPVFSPELVAEITAAIDRVHMDETIVEFLMALVERTRHSDALALGVGPRGGMSLHRASRAFAVLRGRDFVIIDDVKDLAEPVLAHRVIPKGSWDGQGNRQLAQQTIRSIVAALEIPI